MTIDKDTIGTDLDILRDFINKSNDAIFVNDPPTGLFIFVNDKACASLEYDRQELLKMGVTDIETTLPDNFSWQAHVNELRQKGSLIMEGIHKRKNGTTFPVEVNISYVVLNTREYMVAIVRDMSERKQAEEALRKSEERYRSIVETTTEWIWEIDLAGNHTFSNPGVTAILGYDPDEFVGQKASSFLHEDDRREVESSLPRLIANKQGWRGWVLRWRHKDGTYRYLESNARPLINEAGECVGYLGADRDITKRKSAEEALRESEERYRALFDRSRDCVFLADFDGHILDANQASLDLFGYHREDISTLTFSSLLSADQLPLAFQTVEEIIATGHQKSPTEYRVRHKDGHHVIVEIQASLIYRDGKPFAIQGIARDITEQKRAEKALRESEKKFRLLVENAYEGILVAQEGMLKFVNPRGLQMSGYTFEELASQPFTEFIHPEDRAMVFERHLKRMKGEIDPADAYSFRFVRKDGEIRWLEMKGALSSWEDRPASVNFLSDITERVTAEKELLKAQKLESLGILAGGIAHDFNNILTAILGNISLARVKMKPDEPQSKWLEEAERASYHAEELTQQLLTFAKGGAPVKSTVPLKQFIRDTVGFAMRGSNVSCDFSFSDDLLPVDVDEGQMGQVFNNLVINACQAMPGGGTIKIDAQNVEFGSKDGLPPLEGKYVKITIEDQGTGIPEEHLQKIFDPYFTTKQKGSGLGLSIVYSVIRNHNGHVAVQSQLGAGTTFTIYLPASVEKVVERKSEGREHIFGKGRVLLMDDEEIVRKVAGEILKEMGYEVEFAPDGAEAIRLYKTAMESSRPFDAVIMDLTVPGGMGGEEAIQKLHEVDPCVKAIVSSGYSQDSIMANYKEYGFREVIAKPFSSSELSRIMHKVISEP